MEVPVIVGEDAIVRRVAKLADRLAATTHAIFISGESGTGREHVARFLHARGPRAVAPFSIFDCGAAVRGACIEELSARLTVGGTTVIDNCEALRADESAAIAALIDKRGAASRVVFKSFRTTVELRIASRR
ncbi:MAG TPA: hypothetical protein ENO14_02365 [Chromatiales bacterium]|nr:hypothetical protein [Chromatiales bacterium]